ncbi:hypothetical protein V3851_15105 [Paenibacillus sp. M1]|uniref:DUF4879 domain-containing protein n=1 Tax=Paenibacillus haidiansis TaxID=1574488 RepID=A0ABU7VTT2_9BACL
MKKKMMSLLSVLFLSLFLAVSVSTAASIDGAKGASSSTDITWAYTKIDADGKVIEEGIIPMQSAENGTIKPQMVWKGIILENNEGAYFYPVGQSSGLYAVEDTEMIIKYQLSRSAKHRAWVRAYYTPGEEWAFEGTTSSLSALYYTPVDDYYLGWLKNLSSDEFTINQFEISF